MSAATSRCRSSNLHSAIRLLSASPSTPTASQLSVIRRDHRDLHHRRVGVWVASLTIAAVLLLTDWSIRQLGGWSSARSLANYWLGIDQSLRQQAAPGLVVRGEPVFYRRPDQSWAQVGYVESVVSQAAATGQAATDAPRGTPRANDQVIVRWHDRELDPTAHQLVAYEYRGSLQETAAVLFPPEKREAIRRLLKEAFAQSGESLGNRFLPLIQRSVRESLPVFERELYAAVDRNRAGWQRISDKWKDDLIRERLVPLAKDPILPIARRHVEPTLSQIGRELWDRASVWRFTWRALYDSVPLPQRDLTREEWGRFLREEGVPIFEAHAAELAVAIQATVVEIARNPQVRAELDATLSDLAEDPELREWLRGILRETLVDSPAVRDAWMQVWTSDEARAAFDSASRSIEPLIRQIGDEVLGTRETGIDPGFARVLRNQILGKDKRWLVAVPKPADEAGMAIDGPADQPGLIRRGSGDPTYPLLPLAPAPAPAQSW